MRNNIITNQTEKTKALYNHKSIELFSSLKQELSTLKISRLLNGPYSLATLTLILLTQMAFFNYISVGVCNSLKINEVLITKNQINAALSALKET